MIGGEVIVILNRPVSIRVTFAILDLILTGSEFSQFRGLRVAYTRSAPVCSARNRTMRSWVIDASINVHGPVFRRVTIWTADLSGLDSNIECGDEIGPSSALATHLFRRRALQTHLFGHWQLQCRMTVFFSCAVYTFAYLLTYLLDFMYVASFRNHGALNWTGQILQFLSPSLVKIRVVADLQKCIYQGKVS